MWQIYDPGEEHVVWAASGRMESQAEVLEGSVVTLDSKLDMDMEANSVTVKQRTSTAATQSWKKIIIKCLDYIMDITDDKWQEANEYRRQT